MKPLPFSVTGARVAFFAILATFLVLEQRTRILSWTRRGDGERQDHGTFVVVVASIAIGLAGAGVVAGDVTSAELSGVRWPLFVAGLALMLAGIVVRQWAVAMLGRSFTVVVRVREGQEVIDTGPYRWVRHPSYTGMLMTFTGYGLALGNWISILLAVLAPLAGIVVRIHFEEQALLQGLGEPYRRFAADRKRLVPGVW